MAHKKGGGSSRNGRDSKPKLLGVKVFAGQVVPGGLDHRPPARHAVPPGDGTGHRPRPHDLRDRDAAAWSSPTAARAGASSCTPRSRRPSRRVARGGALHRPGADPRGGRPRRQRLPVVPARAARSRAAARTAATAAAAAAWCWSPTSRSPTCRASATRCTTGAAPGGHGEGKARHGRAGGRPAGRGAAGHPGAARRPHDRRAGGAPASGCRWPGAATAASATGPSARPPTRRRATRCRARRARRPGSPSSCGCRSTSAIVGLPNSGKSALLAALTGAAPVVAAYPHSTREPAFGPLEDDDGDLYLVADLPGLAADGTPRRRLPPRAARARAGDPALRRRLRPRAGGRPPGPRARGPGRPGARGRARAGRGDRAPTRPTRRPASTRPWTPRTGAGVDELRARVLAELAARLMAVLVVKLGSSTLVDPGGRLRDDVLEARVRDLVRVRRQGHHPVLVTSGAIACGLGRLGIAERPTAAARPAGRLGGGAGGAVPALRRGLRAPRASCRRRCC